VRDLVEILKLPQPTISRHLSYLRRAIASSAWRDNRGNNADKRKKTAATLGERLRWKPFEEIK
jgi:DNA-binding transcriptional ArsR family regulator